jgi:sugar/nucleoside kinase (ribokinase family)
MFSHRGANTQLTPADIDEKAFQKAAMLHISGYALLESPQRMLLACSRTGEKTCHSGVPGYRA